jgi:hypothetical protein
MALALIRPTTPLGPRRPDKAEPPSGKKPSKRPETICRMALTLIWPTTSLGPRRPDKAEPPSGKKNIKKAGNINVFPAFDLNGI